MKKITLTAEKREIKGRKVNSLRREGILPANLFGKNIKSEAIKLPLSDFLQVYDEAGETNIINLLIAKDEHPVLISNVSIHPVSGEVLHVDFREVNLKEKVTATVPVELEGEAPAEKQGIGNLVQLLNELDVEALPMDLPEKLVADITVLTELDQTITVADLKYDKDNVKVEAEAEEAVVKIEEPQKEEIVEPVVAEGEAPAEEGKEESPKEETSETPKEE